MLDDVTIFSGMPLPQPVEIGCQVGGIRTQETVVGDVAGALARRGIRRVVKVIYDPVRDLGIDIRGYLVFALLGSLLKLAFGMTLGDNLGVIPAPVISHRFRFKTRLSPNAGLSLNP